MSDNAVIAKPVIVHEGVQTCRRQADLLVEEPLEIRVNGTPYAVIMRTPGHETELAAGFCLTEGLVESLADIHTMGFCAHAPAGLQNIVNVIVARKTCVQEDEHAAPPARAARKVASPSSYGLCGGGMLQDAGKKITPVDSGLRLVPADIFRMAETLFEHQKIFSSTRASHAAALFRSTGKLIAMREDVGRHNALDKVIGHALLSGLDCGECIAFLSSRISFEMAQKALRARIPVVAAVSAATSLAVDLAAGYGCTLIGRVREESMIVYAHPERITCCG